jgi:hypothetical protein
VVRWLLRETAPPAAGLRRGFDDLGMEVPLELFGVFCGPKRNTGVTAPDTGASGEMVHGQALL